MKFTYLALNSEKQRVRGELEASDARRASRELTKRGLVPLGLAPFKGSKVTRKRRPPRSTEIRLAMQQLVTLLRSGVTLNEAVSSLSRSAQHPAIAGSFEDLSKRLRRGEGFASALAEVDLRLPGYFNPLARAGELTGELASALGDGLAQMAYEEEVATEMRNALIYPSILVTSGIGAVLLIFTMVVPRFSGMLQRSEDLPALAWVVLSLGQLFNQYIWLILSVIVGLLFTVYGLVQQPESRQRLWDLLARLPLIGPWLQEADLARWCGLLATLLGHRVGLVDGLQLSERGVRVSWLRNRLQQVLGRVKSGHSLTEALREAHAFTDIGLDMVQVGERTGELPAMLLSLRTVFSDSGRNRMKRFLLLLEPLAILLIGGVVGVIMTGIILAITSLNDVAL